MKNKIGEISKLKCRDREIILGERTLIMGIMNMTIEKLF